MTNKTAQKTVLDEKNRPTNVHEDYDYGRKQPVLPFYPDHENFEKRFNIEQSLKRRDQQRAQEIANRNHPPGQPLNLSYPELTPDQIRARNLSPEELQQMRREDAEQRKSDLEYHPWGNRYYRPSHEPAPETIENPAEPNHLPHNHREYRADLEFVPEKAKAELLRTYGQFRETVKRFQVMYAEANKLASSKPRLNYQASYADLIRSLPSFVIDSVKARLGELFGTAPEGRSRWNYGSRADRLISFIREGVNLFNLTPKNYDETISKLSRAMSDMESIMQQYRSQQRVLKKLPDEVRAASKDFFRVKSNREFLAWMEEYFPNEKEEFVGSIVSGILEGGDHQIGMSLSSLDKIKTLKAIHDKAAATQGLVFNNTQRRVLDTVKRRMTEEAETKAKARFDTMRLILQSSQPEAARWIEFRRFLNRYFRIDIQSLIGFTNMIIDKDATADEAKSEFAKANPEGWKAHVAEKKTKLLTGFIERFIEANANTSRNKIEGHVAEFINGFVVRDSNNRQGIIGSIDVNGLSKAGPEVIDAIVGKLVRRTIVDAMPNMRPAYQSHKDNTLPNFGVAIAKLFEESGNLSPGGLANEAARDMPFVPKEFWQRTMQSLVRGTASQSATNTVDAFARLSTLKEPSSKAAVQLMMRILERSGKPNPDVFAKVFIDSLNPLQEMILTLNRQLGSIMKSQALFDMALQSLRGPTTIQQDAANISAFADFVHNEASGLSRQDLAAIVKNPNFSQFTKLGIVRKIISAYASIRGEGGPAGIRKQYGAAVRELIRHSYISKDFFANLDFILGFFRSNAVINPSSEAFKKAFEIASSVETDLEILEMSGSFKELVRDYRPKDPSLFQLDLQLTPDLRFRVLKDKDPRALRVGVETNCCQRIGGIGESAAKDSFINPLAGVLILEWNRQGSWELLGQSYFHYVPKDKSFILDNIESNKANVQASGVNLDACYAALADYAKEKLGVTYFLAGTGYSKVRPDSFSSYRMDEDPREFDPRSVKTENGYNRGDVYSDWDEDRSIDLLRPNESTELAMRKLQGRASTLPRESNDIKQALTRGLNLIVRATMFHHHLLVSG